MTAVYVHVPFCASRCIYCDFVSSTLGAEWREAYLRALDGEMDERASEAGGQAVATVYVGGGTPSALGPEGLSRLLRRLGERFAVTEETEFTVELNPDDVTPSLAASLRNTPANRISMGVQTLDDRLLRFLGRRHTAGQALRAVETLMKAGFGNVSLDLMYGIPGQTAGMFAGDVRRALATGATHLSAYALQYETRTTLGGMLARGEVSEVDEEVSLACYETLMELAEKAGMEHYEISNFARPGFRSRHNSRYWDGSPYIGFGPGAHSYDGRRTRSANTADVRAYIEGKAGRTFETLSREELYDERVMLRLRTREGLSLESVRRDFGEEMASHCLAQASPHVSRGTLSLDGTRLRLTRRGLFVSNDIISDLMA